MASPATTGFQFVMAPCGGITAIGDETPETLIDRVLDVYKIADSRKPSDFATLGPRTDGDHK